MREPLPEAGGADDSADPVRRAIANADFDALRRALRELPRRQRRVFVLRELSGLTYAELAVALEVTEPAVESLLFRARRELRTRLGSARGVITIPIGFREALSLKVATAAVGMALVAGGAVVLERDRTRHEHVVRDDRMTEHVRRVDRAPRSGAVARELAPAVAPAAPSPPAAPELAPAVAPALRVRRPIAEHAERGHLSEEQEAPAAEDETEPTAAESEATDTETSLQEQEPSSDASGDDSGSESDPSESDSADG